MKNIRFERIQNNLKKKKENLVNNRCSWIYWFEHFRKIIIFRSKSNWDR